MSSVLSNRRPDYLSDCMYDFNEGGGAFAALAADQCGHSLSGAAAAAIEA
jgi:hypothetical protein